MMTEGSLCLYIAAVLIFTVIPIRGQKEKCKNKDFEYADGACYKLYRAKLSWTAAKENCEKQNAELAPYSNLKQIRTFCKIVGTYFWVKGPEPQELGLQWSYACIMDYFTLFYEDCKDEFQYFCIETNETPETKPKLVSRSTENRNAVNEISKLTCKRNDSVLVGGQCYRSPAEEMIPSDAADFYCSDHNETLATISSIEQGIKVIKSLDLIGEKLWVKNQFQTREGTFVGIMKNDHCQHFEIGNLPEKRALRFLCMELAIPYIETTTRPASITTQESQRKKKDGLQLKKKVGQKTRVDLNTNLYFYEK